ncbi:MAG: diguanylate cyclase, partial [Lachnospiraceae bacterium]|nr:diguanylate cyclase [Lachnospiraceae bacterium]
MEEAMRKELLNMPRIRQEHSDSMYFYKNIQTGFCYLESNPYLPEQLKNTRQDLLKELYTGKWVCDEDRSKIMNLYERMEQGTREPIHMTELSADLHLQIDPSPKKLYSLTCYLDLDETGCIRSYVGKLYAMGERELQNLQIVQTFTNDKNPIIFISRIDEFMSRDRSREYAFIQFDIRKFRYINEVHGSQIGDQILQYVLDTLKVMCDNNHIYCRLSADLFEIVTYYTTREDILSFIETLDSRLQRWNNIRFSMSYGVAIV